MWGAKISVGVINTKSSGFNNQNNFIKDLFYLKLESSNLHSIFLLYLFILYYIYIFLKCQFRKIVISDVNTANECEEIYVMNSIPCT